MSMRARVQFGGNGRGERPWGAPSATGSRGPRGGGLELTLLGESGKLMRMMYKRAGIRRCGMLTNGGGPGTGGRGLRVTLSLLYFIRRTAACSLLLLGTVAGAADRPNILLIMADDLRDTVGCYGNAQVKTPNIDRLAARGVRFDRAYVQYPVCNPSRASLLTGMRPEQSGVADNTTPFRKLLPEVVTLPQVLRQSGWHTVSYGKILHTGAPRPDVPGGWLDAEKSWDQAQMFPTTAAGKVIEGRNLTGGLLDWCEWGATAGTDDDQPDGQVALHSIRAMERLTAEGKPWLIGAGFHRPHDPFIAPKKYFDMYSLDQLQLHRDPANASPLPPLSIEGGDYAKAFDAFTDRDRLEFLRAYYASVTFMDAQVGRLMEALDRLELWDKTVVVFMGDHGYHLNERNWWNKNTLFERSCRVPFIVAAPDAPRGQVRRGLVEMVDLYPTLLDYCAVPAPHKMPGRSLRPQLHDSRAPGRAAAFTFVSRGPHYGQSVRTDRWRYIQWSDGRTELYDAEHDPEEMHDQSARPEHAALIGEMRALLAEHVGSPEQCR